MQTDLKFQVAGEKNSIYNDINKNSLMSLVNCRKLLMEKGAVKKSKLKSNILRHLWKGVWYEKKENR